MRLCQPILHPILLPDIFGAINISTQEYETPQMALKCNKYACPKCNVSVILCKGEKEKMHFKHTCIDKLTPCGMYNYNPPTKDATRLLIRNTNPDERGRTTTAISVDNRTLINALCAEKESITYIPITTDQLCRYLFNQQSKAKLNYCFTFDLPHYDGIIFGYFRILRWTLLRLFEFDILYGEVKINMCYSQGDKYKGTYFAGHHYLIVRDSRYYDDTFCKRLMQLKAMLCEGMSYHNKRPLRDARLRVLPPKEETPWELFRRDIVMGNRQLKEAVLRVLKPLPRPTPTKKMSLSPPTKDATGNWIFNIVDVKR